jgi:glycogen debranching enzyme
MTMGPAMSATLRCPRGATWAKEQTVFCVAAPGAQAVALWLEEMTIPMAQVDGEWVVVVPGDHEGARYRYFVTRDLASSPRVALDPYARRILGDHDGPVSQLYSCVTRATPALPLGSAAHAHGRPSMPRQYGTFMSRWHGRVVYELHVRGFTKLHAQVPEAERGTFRALAHPSVIGYLKSLSVNTVLILPIHAVRSEPRLLQMGLRNYWGYSPLSYFALNPRYGVTPDSVDDDFAAAIAALHQAGIGVLVDVVYNHTSELDENHEAYMLRALAPKAFYESVDRTGCGNTLRAWSPEVIRLVLDSMRQLHRFGVDGFRFDLAAVLGRAPRGEAGAEDASAAFSPEAPLLSAIASDPDLGSCLLMAEPWDAKGGYGLGRFPAPFSEWNDRFRDDVRAFFTRGRGSLSAFADAISGSSARFGHKGSGAGVSVNYVACHDGFTLWDQQCFSAKHNHANGEDNRDGMHDRFAQNHGVEGPSDDQTLLAARRGRAIAFLASVWLAKGTPMFAQGDDRGRSQQGNNNAYCQDNALSWLNWAEDDGLLRSAWATLAAIRCRCVPLVSSRYYEDATTRWFDGEGKRLIGARWQEAPQDALMVLVEDAWLFVFESERRDAALPLVQLAKENELWCCEFDWYCEFDSENYITREPIQRPETDALPRPRVRVYARAVAAKPESP